MKNRLREHLYGDLELAQEIRKVISGEGYVLVASRNIQVIVEDGLVILKGEVFADQERTVLGNRVASYVGPENIINQLEVLEEME